MGWLFVQKINTWGRIPRDGKEETQSQQDHTGQA